MTDEKLHIFAREISLDITDLDKKQLRYNDIIRVAKAYYNDPKAGVKELVESCGRSSDLYVHKKPMWQVLETEYKWMIAHG